LAHRLGQKLVQAFFQNAKWTDRMVKKVLVVDDELEIRDLLSKFLAEEGYEVIVASNGEEAIELAKSESPNVILLDIKMPGIDGIETCRILRAQEQTRFIPVIMITGFGTTTPEATDAGADDIIFKPFNLADLAVRVKSILSIERVSDRAQRLMTYLDELDKNLQR
jgi:DNA-binding response OmpR family regulator